MNLDASISTSTRDAQKALSLAARIVATAPATPSARLHALQKMADHLRQYVQSGWLSPATATDKIFEVAESHGLTGEPGSDKEATVMQIAMSANLPLELHPRIRSERGSNGRPIPTPPSLETKTPSAWKETEPLKQRWLAAARIPCGDITLYSGNGGAGKTETAVQLLVSVTAGLGDWLGCVVETGPALFLSCEEPEPNIRDASSASASTVALIRTRSRICTCIFPTLRRPGLRLRTGSARSRKPHFFCRSKPGFARTGRSLSSSIRSPPCSTAKLSPDDKSAAFLSFHRVPSVHRRARGCNRNG
jgi:hypothetical protein